MTTFVFHVQGRPEEKKVDLPDLASAKCEAVRYAGNLICDQAQAFWDEAEFNLSVSDEQGLTLFALTMTGVDAPAIRKPSS
jgi:hypothetical protein